MLAMTLGVFCTYKSIEWIQVSMLSLSLTLGVSIPLKYYLLVTATPQRNIFIFGDNSCISLCGISKQIWSSSSLPLLKLHWKVVQSFWTHPGSQNSDRKYISKPNEGWYQYDQLTHSDTFNFHTPRLIIDNPLQTCWIPSPNHKLCKTILEFFLNGAEFSLNSVISPNSGNLINHWSMNWDQIKDPCLSHESCWCCGGILVFYTEVVGSSPFNDKYFCPWIQWKHLG